MKKYITDIGVIYESNITSKHEPSEIYSTQHKSPIKLRSHKGAKPSPENKDAIDKANREKDKETIGVIDLSSDESFIKIAKKNKSLKSLISRLKDDNNGILDEEFQKSRIPNMISTLYSIYGSEYPEGISLLVDFLINVFLSTSIAKDTSNGISIANKYNIQNKLKGFDTSAKVKFFTPYHYHPNRLQDVHHNTSDKKKGTETRAPRIR